MKHKNTRIMIIATAFILSCSAMEEQKVIQSKKVPSLRFQMAYGIAKRLVESKASTSEINKQLEKLPPELQEYVHILGYNLLNLVDAFWYVLAKAPYKIDMIIDLIHENPALINAISPKELSNKPGLQQIRNHTPLSYSIEKGFYDIVELLLDNGADIKMEAGGFPPLAVAIMNNHSRIVKLLLINDANPNYIFHGITPLTLAALCSLQMEYTFDRANGPSELYLALDSKKILIKLGQINDTTIDLVTKIPYSIEELNEFIAPAKVKIISESRSVPNLDILQLLFQFGADPNLKDEVGWTPLLYTCQFYSLELVKLFVEHKAEINVRNNTGQTPLMLASQFDRTAIMEYLITNKADVNAQDAQGDTALIWATRREYKSAVDILLRHKANANLQDTSRMTALLYATAAVDDLHDILAALINHGANVNIATPEGLTALMIAALNGKLDCVNLLLNANANINVQDPQGKTALAYALQVPLLVVNREMRKLNQPGITQPEALKIFNQKAMGAFNSARKNAEAIASALLDKGANVNLQENSGTTPLILAAQDNLPTLVTRLLTAGAAINHVMRNNISALIAAAFFGNTEVVKILLAHGANKDIVDRDGYTALGYAQRYDYQEIIKLLSE